MIYFQNNIQQNKDWNVKYSMSNNSTNTSRITSNKIRIETRKHQQLAQYLRPSRITSNKIRIETHTEQLISAEQPAFQNNIQQNKDWNKVGGAGMRTFYDFQNNIQQNKDWNTLVIILGLAIILLPE